MLLNYASCLFIGPDIRQEGKMAGAFYLMRQITLAAGAVAGLTARTYLASFCNVAFERFDIFIVEAFPLWAVFCPPGTPPLWAWSGPF
jgi:hypothetical protein